MDSPTLVTRSLSVNLQVQFSLFVMNKCLALVSYAVCRLTTPLLTDFIAHKSVVVLFSYMVHELYKIPSYAGCMACFHIRHKQIKIRTV